MGNLKKHLTCGEVSKLLASEDVTMGNGVCLIVIVNGKEYPVVGGETVDGCLFGLTVGAELSDQSMANSRRDGDSLFVEA